MVVVEMIVFVKEEAVAVIDWSPMAVVEVITFVKEEVEVTIP